MTVPSPDPSYFPGLPRYLSFVDESGHARDPKRNSLCLAGLIASEGAWGKFDADWRTACEDEGLTEPFHMMHFSARKRQFKGWTEERRRRLLGKLVDVIRKARTIPIGSVVMLRGPDGLPERVQQIYRDAHFIAFQPLTYNIAIAATMMDPRAGAGPGPVTMVFAHHPEHSQGLTGTRELWSAIRKSYPLVAVLMQSYVSGSPKECAPLQAADLWAYELGHHFECIRPSGKPPRWAFRQFVEMGLNYAFTHNFITYHGASGTHGIGRMARVQNRHEVSLYRPGFIPTIPPASETLPHQPAPERARPG